MRLSTVAVFLAAAVHAVLLNGLCAATKLDVELEADKCHYVVGEMVVLQVKVENNGDINLPVWIDLLDSQIQIFLASPDAVARQFIIGGRAIPSVVPNAIALPPGESKYYPLRLLHHFSLSSEQGPISTLAFPETGEYEIFVKYPLFPERELFESNRIRIRVDEPKGGDAEVWQQLNDEKVLFFLQRGELWLNSQEVPRKVGEILTGVSDSAYHSTMRWALGRHYHRLRIENPAPEDIENGKLFRKALGIMLQHPSDRWEELFEDERLYVRRLVFTFPEPTPLDEAFALATRKTGVLLKRDPTVSEERWLRAEESDKSLAEFMRIFTAGGYSTWVRDGRGYRLVPVTETDKQPGGPKHAGPPP